MQDRWLYPVQHSDDPAVRLICFPHAGGSAAFYHEWRGALPPDIAIYAVQYPGRANRLSEPMIDDAHRLATEVVPVLRPLADRPLALFGHSMGSLIAYEVAVTLQEQGVRIAALFISGRSAPHVPSDRPSLLHDDDNVLVANLARLGGTDAEALSDPELRELALPYVRNDLRLARDYRHRECPALECPVTALVGDADNEVSLSTVRRWADLTSEDFTMRVLPGGHFYLVPSRDKVLAEVGLRLGRRGNHNGA